VTCSLHIKDLFCKFWVGTLKPLQKAKMFSLPNSLHLSSRVVAITTIRLSHSSLICKYVLILLNLFSSWICMKYLLPDFQNPTIKGLSWSWSYGSWIYNYLCNQCLSPLKLWAPIPLVARCTRYNIMWKSLSVTFGWPVVFSGFLPQKILKDTI
jgi:hypothetical protein